MQYAAAVAAGLCEELSILGIKTKMEESALYDITNGNERAAFFANDHCFQVRLNGPHCEVDLIQSIKPRMPGNPPMPAIYKNKVYDSWLSLDLVARVDAANPKLFQLLIKELMVYIARRDKHSRVKAEIY